MKNSLIDCDVHPSPKNISVIHEYLPKRWHHNYFFRGRPFYTHPNHVFRLDAVTPEGDLPGSDPEFMREQLLDKYGIEYAILLPLPYVNMHPNPYMAKDLAAAYNQWLDDVWLSGSNEDGRYKGSITVAPTNPKSAVKEIEKWADHPHMVQVIMDSGADTNYGHMQFYPIYEICEHYGLPIALHPTGEGLGISRPASSGYPTTYMEWSIGLTFSIQAHLVSFVTEGVFERFPNLKLVLVEGGSAWIPSLMWRMDNSWKGLRDEVPWLKKRPSEYIKEHVRITSQPLETSDRDEHLLYNFEMMDAKKILMFASDYPHWDFDSPVRAFPKLPDELKKKIFYENAKELYQLA